MVDVEVSELAGFYLFWGGVAGERRGLWGDMNLFVLAVMAIVPARSICESL